MTDATIADTSSSDAISHPSVDLRLEAQLSTDSGTGVVAIRLEEVNTLSTVNNVTARDSWPYSPARLNYQCGNWAQIPIGYAIFQGNYGTNNYTTGTALTLYDSEFFASCPTMVVPIVYYLFDSQSHNVSRFFGSQRPAGNLSISITTRARGYWSGGLDTGMPSLLHPFPRGTYTVLVEDEWGGLLLLHFKAI